MKRYLIILWGVIFVIPLQAQVFKDDVALFDDEPFFNELWVTSNRVHEIRGEVSFKRDGQPIADSRQFYHYTFDRLGRMVSSITTFSIQGRVDTISIYYFYNEEGRLSKMAKSDAYGFFAMNYIYNSSGRLVRQYHSRETMKEGEKVSFTTEKIVWDDSIKYLDFSPFITKSTYLNKNGKPFKDISYYYDEDHLLSLTESRNLIGSDFTVTTYSRNADGRLTSWEEKSNMEYSSHWKKEFTYDVQGRIDMETVHKNEKLYHTRKITYNDRGLMDLQLTRNRVTGIMEIVQYEYRFY